MAAAEVSALQWLQILGLGGTAGAIGQMGRVVIGLGKLSLDAPALNTNVNNLIQPARLVISVVIGFSAGALTAMVAGIDAAGVSGEQVLALAGAGYAGTDAIEGVLLRASKRFTGDRSLESDDDRYVG